MFHNLFSLNSRFFIVKIKLFPRHNNVANYHILSTWKIWFWHIQKICVKNWTLFTRFWKNKFQILPKFHNRFLQVAKIHKEIFLKSKLWCLMDSQIWLNVPVNDHQFGYIHRIEKEKENTEQYVTSHLFFRCSFSFSFLLKKIIIIKIFSFFLLVLYRCPIPPLQQLPLRFHFAFFP